MKFTLAKFLQKRGVRASLIFTMAAGVSGVVTYYALPMIQNSDTKSSVVLPPDDPEVPRMTSTDKFVSKLTATTGIEGTLDFSMSFPDKDNDASTVNQITVTGATLKMAIPSLKNIGFDFQGTVNYNNWNEAALQKATTHINFCDRNAYIDLWGAKLAYLDTEYHSLVGELIAIFGDSVVKIPDSVYEFIDQLGGEGADSSADSSLADTSIEWNVLKESEESSEFQCTIGLGDTDFVLNLDCDKDYNLTRVYANQIQYQDTVFSLDFKTQVNDGELTAIRNLIPTDSANYVSLMGLKGIMRKVGRAVAKERLNADLTMNLTHGSGETLENAFVSLKGSADIASQNYRFDLQASDEELGTAKGLQSLQFAYVTENQDSTAYINYNDMAKASMKLVTLEALAERVKNQNGATDNAALEKTFSTIFDSDIIKDIRNGRYEKLAEDIGEITVANESITVEVKLNRFGLGKDAKATIALEGAGDKPVASIEVSGIALKDFGCHLTFNVEPYKALTPLSTGGFYQMDHLPDIYDQVKEIAQNKQATLGLDGSVMDANQYGISFDGDLSIDGAKKAGSGAVVLNQKNANYTKQHAFKVDVYDANGYFNYNDANATENEPGLNGKIAISSINDMVELVKTLSGEETVKTRLSRLVFSFSSVTTPSLLNDIMNGKYFGLLSAKILKSCTLSSSGATFVINGALFGLDTDLPFALIYEDKTSATQDQEGNPVIVRQLKSLSLQDFAFKGKTIRFTLSFKTYDAKLSRLDKTATYQDFSSLNLLLKSLANTATKLTTYHFAASMSVTLWTADIIDIDADIYLSLAEDGGIKVFGSLRNIPLIPAVNNDTWLTGEHGDGGSFYRSVDFYYDQKAVYTHGVNPFGTFEATNDDGSVSTYDFTETQDTKYTPSYFKKTDNILSFVLKDVVNLQPRLLEKVQKNDLSLPESKQALATEKLLQSFAYAADTRSWDITMDLGGLLSNDFLKTLTVQLGTTTDEYLQSVCANLLIFAGVRIELNAAITLEDIGQDSFPTDAFDTYLSAHEADVALDA